MDPVGNRLSLRACLWGGIGKRLPAWTPRGVSCPERPVTDRTPPPEGSAAASRCWAHASILHFRSST
eukprot:15468115-Alexandrium_andersonii.AAC.1